MNQLWIDFVNSRARDHLGGGQHVDRLEEPGWYREFLRRVGLSSDELGSQTDRERLRELRRLLFRIVGRILDRKPATSGDLKQLNKYLGTSVKPKLRAHDGKFELQLEPTGGAADRALFVIAASFAEFLAECDVHRLKTCDNADCSWVFYDTTKSRTRKWCASNCGNLIKVRQFRERKRAK